MIQTSTFALSKDMARLPYQAVGHLVFRYLGDIHNQWESSDRSAKALDLIGIESMPPGHLVATQQWLGPLSAEETQFAYDASSFLNDVAKLITTLPPSFDPLPDLYETILDTRLLAPHLEPRRRVLDIGAGAGRHLLNIALRPGFAGSSYCSIDSVGLPYLLQNTIAGALSLRDPALTFTDTLDFESAQRAMTLPQQPVAGSIWHLPLWHADRLPDRAFDLILCNYVLDEVPEKDFGLIMAVIGRCLAPEGVVYCRGGQQKSMLKDLHLYGLGTYHGQDITAAFRNAGLAVKECALVTGAMTRIFVRLDSRTHRREESAYAAMDSDLQLVEAMQRDFIRESVDSIKRGGLRTLVWSDPGHAVAQRYLSDVASELPIIGATNYDTLERSSGPFGWTVYPLEEIASLRPQAIIVAGSRFKFGVRELTEYLGPLHSVLSFNFPIAVCYTGVPPPAAASVKPPLATAGMEVTLVRQDVFGYNILHLRDQALGDKYYGLLQSDGPFEYERLAAGAYTRHVEGENLEEVEARIRNQRIYGTC